MKANLWFNLRIQKKPILKFAKIGFVLLDAIRQPLDPSNSWTGGFASLSYLSFALAMHMKLVILYHLIISHVYINIIKLI